MFEDEGRKTSVGRQIIPGDEPTSRAKTGRFRPRGKCQGGISKRSVNWKRPGAPVQTPLRDDKAENQRNRLRPAADWKSRRLNNGPALSNVFSEADWREAIARLMKTDPQGNGALDGDLARLWSLSCAHTMETTRITVRGDRVTLISVKRVMGSTETRTSRCWCGGNASA
jgi:hypothetical protein